MSMSPARIAKLNRVRIATLEPDTARLAGEFVGRAAKAGIVVLVTEGYRSIDRQNHLYALGRTRTGRRVTNARGGFSFHQYRVAFDVVPIVGGAPAWRRLDLFRRLGTIGKNLGLTWGGDFRRPDMPHFQHCRGRTIEEFRRGGVVPRVRTFRVTVPSDRENQQRVLREMIDVTGFMWYANSDGTISTTADAVSLSRIRRLSPYKVYVA